MEILWKTAHWDRSVYLRFIVVLCIATLWGCGETKFSGTNGSKKNTVDPSTPEEKKDTPPNSSDDNPVVVDTGDESLGLISTVEWFWQCETAPVPLPDALESGHKLIVGEGPHEIKLDSKDEITLNISGFLCPPSNYARDIVVVVDVSFSNSDTDKKSAGTCERRKAVEELVKDLKSQQKVHFGLVTFSNAAEMASNKLIAIRDFDLSNDTWDSLCDYKGGTDYTNSLDAAMKLLETGRVGVKKEIYFISDGEPDDSRTNNFEPTIDKAKQIATLATIMYGSKSDKILREKVASQDNLGNPIHTKTENVKKLTEDLTKLSRSIPVKGSYKYRSGFSQDWQKKDLWDHVNKGVFKIDEFSLSRSDFERGFEFSYTYEDDRGDSVSQTGKIVWKLK